MKKKSALAIFVFLVAISICSYTIMQAKANPATISLSANAGRTGESINVSGTGFNANATLSATFDSSPVTLDGTTNTNASGAFSGAQITIPPSSAGDHQITVSDGSNNASDTFTVYNQYQVNASYTTLDPSIPSASIVLSGTSLGQFSPPR